MAKEFKSGPFKGQSFLRVSLIALAAIVILGLIGNVLFF